MYKLEKILCPTDFSASSLDAIRFAIHATERLKGTITLLFVDGYFTTAPGYFMQSEQQRLEHHKVIEELAHNKFSEIVQTLQLDKDRTNFLIRSGTPYIEIINEAETNGYSAVVLSTLGLGRSSPHLIGRTAERVVRLIRTPIFTVGPQNTILIPKITTILCSTDFSEYGNYALPYAISIAQQYSARLFLVHIADISFTHPERLMDKFPDLNIYHDNANDVFIEKIIDKDIEPENAIVRLAQEYEADLIVMGTHGARGMRRVQIGNTTEEVVRRVSVPVLTVTHPVHKVVFRNRFGEYQQ
ncbi:MAG: universal stress protein [Ignavibacteriales bacterium]|nr:universal stress protein [Ignavibacteriales bacterium]